MPMCAEMYSSGIQLSYVTDLAGERRKLTCKGLLILFERSGLQESRLFLFCVVDEL